MAGLRLGLTGGIGSGKSTSASCLRAWGWRVVDTDAIARSLSGPGGAALAAIAERFGPSVMTPQGDLDRAALRLHVFQHPPAKVELEGLLHPLILEEALRQAQGHEWVVFDVPLLAESGRWRTRVDRVLVIDCDPEVQAARVAARPGWSAEQARQVIAQQASRPQRRQVADAVLDNSGNDPTLLRQALQTLVQSWGGPVKESGS